MLLWGRNYVHGTVQYHTFIIVVLVHVTHSFLDGIIHFFVCRNGGASTNNFVATDRQTVPAKILGVGILAWAYG